jgi:hypothetical protein
MTVDIHLKVLLIEGQIEKNPFGSAIISRTAISLLKNNCHFHSERVLWSGGCTVIHFLSLFSMFPYTMASTSFVHTFTVGSLDLWHFVVAPWPPMLQPWEGGLHWLQHGVTIFFCINPGGKTQDYQSGLQSQTPACM